MDEQELEDIELPETVKRGKVIKSSFMELEVQKCCPVYIVHNFLWKALCALIVLTPVLGHGLIWWVYNIQLYVLCCFTVDPRLSGQLWAKRISKCPDNWICPDK